MGKSLNVTYISESTSAPERFSSWVHRGYRSA